MSGSFRVPDFDDFDRDVNDLLNLPSQGHVGMDAKLCGGDDPFVDVPCYEDWAGSQK